MTDLFVNIGMKKDNSGKIISSIKKNFFKLQISNRLDLNGYTQQALHVYLNNLYNKGFGEKNAICMYSRGTGKSGRIYLRVVKVYMILF